MQIKLSIPVLLELSNLEAVTYLTVSIKGNSFNEITALTTYSPDTTRKHIEKLKEFGVVTSSLNGLKNNYTTVLTDPFIIVDSELLDLPVDPLVIGTVLRLKCLSRINSNKIDLSLNRIVHEFKIQHNSVYNAINAGLLKREDESKRTSSFVFIHPYLCHLA